MVDFIINSNTIFIELKEDIESFKKEVQIIDEAKCHLINYKNLDDFEYNGAYAYENGNGYELVYDDLHLLLEVEDGVIVDYIHN